MLETHDLLLFAAASLALLLVPGPAVLYIVARSLHQGRRAGLVSTLGIGTGTVVHVFAAAFGLSALLVRSAFAYEAVKLLGAAYLIFLGIATLRGGDRATGASPGSSPGAVSTEPLWRIFRQGVVVNVLNPKTALFFLAFLPQFVDPGRGAVASQIILLGFVFIVLGVLSDGLWAFLAGSAGRWLAAHPRYLRTQRRLTGGTYLALGAGTAMAEA